MDGFFDGKTCTFVVAIVVLRNYLHMLTKSPKFRGFQNLKNSRFNDSSWKFFNFLYFFKLGPCFSCRISQNRYSHNKLTCVPSKKLPKLLRIDFFFHDESLHLEFMRFWKPQKLGLFVNMCK